MHYHVSHTSDAYVSLQYVFFPKEYYEKYANTKNILLEISVVLKRGVGYFSTVS
jgi:hypothetical protein